MLILKQNAANTVPTPPAGKGTIFLDDSDTLSVKTSDGNVETFPTVAASNSQVVFMNGTALSGEAALTYNFNTNVLTVSGNVAAGNVLTDNLLYANGAAWDLSDPGGSNTQLQFNDDESFGGSANLTFNKSTNLLTLAGTANISEINTTGNLLVGGNLTVNGNVTYINVDTLQVEDPIISLGGGPNGAPLASDDGKDRGTALQYYSGTAKTAFMGYDNSNAEFGMGNVVSITSDVVTFSTYGNLRVGNIIGNGQALTGLTGGNVTGQVGNALVSGTVYTNAQPNITSVGTLTSVLVGSTSLAADFPNAKAIVSQDNTGQTHSENIGLVGEAVADSGNSATWGIGVLGEARANGGTKATGVQGGAYVTNSADTGAAVGVRGYSTQTHSGGYNIGVLGNAAGSGLGNYAFYVQAGNIASIETDTAWDLYDNSANALAFNSSGKANILRISTVDGSEGVAMSGTLNVTGNANVGNLGAAAGVFTANVTAANIYANSGIIGAQNLKGEGGNISNIQGANVSGAVGSATTAATVTTAAQPNITSTGTLTSLDVTGNVTAGNVYANSGTIGASLLTGTLTTNAQPNITSVGTLTSVTVSGNANVANLNASAGVIASTLTSNVATGTAPLTVTSTTRVANLNVATSGVANTVNDAAQPNITSVGTLTSVAVSGNGTFGNVYANSGTIGASLLTGTLTTASQPNVTSVGTLTSLTVTGKVTAGQLQGDGGNISNVTAGNITGQVANSLVSGTVYTAAQPNITSVGTLTSLTVTGKVTAGQLQGDGGNISNVTAGNITGQVANSLVAGTVYTAAQPNITSVGTLTSLTLSGNLAMGTKNITGLADPVNAQDAATKNYVDAAVQGLHVHDSCYVATTGTLNAATGGTVAYNNGSSGVGATLTVTGGTYTLIDGGNVQTVGTRILVKNEANAAWNGIYTYTSTTVLTRATDFDTSAEAAGGDFVFVTSGTTQADTGWVQTTDNPTLGTSNIVWTQFSGAGTYTAGTGLTLTGSQFSITNTAVSAGSYGNGDAVATFTVNGQGQLTAASNVAITANAGNLSGTTLKSTVVTSSLTAVGTVTTGIWNNNIGSSATFAAGLSGANLASITGANVTGQVGNALVAGTVYTNAQPNITSVGTLSSLTVTGTTTSGNFATAGNITASFLVSNVATGTAPLTVTSTTLVPNLYVARANISDFESVTTTNTGTLYPVMVNSSATGNYASFSNTAFSLNAATGALSATSFSGSGSGLTSIPAGNLTGTIPSSVLGNSTFFIGTTSIAANRASASQALTGITSIDGFAATVSTAAQPNITSVGTLTSLTVNGNITQTSGYEILTTNAAVSAAGTAQGNATALTTQVNVTSTVASGAGVALPTAAAGLRITVINTAANACLVYPASGGQINALGTNISYSLAAGGRLDFQATSTTQWYTLNATYA